MNNKGKIFMSGGGSEHDSKDFDSYFFKELKNNAKILYIPIALSRTRQGFEKCFDWFSSVVSIHSIEQNKDFDFTMILEDDEIPNLHLFDAVYFGGGNTYKLLNYIHQNNLVIKLKDYFNNEGIVYGGSAGAIIFGKSLKSVIEENDKNYKFEDGMDYLNGNSIRCHYDEEKDKNLMEERSQEFNLKIIALTEGSGIILSEVGLNYIGNFKKF